MTKKERKKLAKQLSKQESWKDALAKLSPEERRRRIAQIRKENR